MKRKSGLAWKNLINNKCPQCGMELIRGADDDYKCGHCGFFCRKERGYEIKQDIMLREEQEHR